jgi:hypothetical protein
MNKRKVIYWNSLRRKLNIFVIILSVILFLLNWIILEASVTENMMSIFQYFILINLPLLIIEMFDRSFNVNERKPTKKYFSRLMLILVFVIPSIDIIVLLS